MRRPRFGLFWQIALYGAALLAVVVLAAPRLGGLVPLPRPTEALEALIPALEGRSREPGAALRLLRGNGAPPATLFALDGGVVASSAAPPLPFPAPEERPSHLHDERYLGGEPLRIAVRLAGDELLVIAPLRPSAGRVAGVVASALAIFAVLVLLASLPMAHVIASPVVRLTRAARALGAGELGARSGLNAAGEVGELAAAFDEMAERVQGLVRAERELVANVSHELRTPLARMRVALELAQAKGASRAAQTLDELGQDVAELERLVEELLAVARLDLAAQAPSGGLPALRRTLLAVDGLAQDCAERFRRRFPERTLHVELAQTPPLQADETLLRRALDNLLDNARKYSSGELHLRVRLADGAVELEVEDHGEGMSAEDVARAFTPFFRADTSRDRASGGVGLGLSLTRKIAEAHGGRAQLRSRPGGGTVVWLTLPT